MRDEWKRQMKDTVDKQAQAHTKQLEELRQRMEGSTEARVQNAQNEVRAQMAVELRRAIAKIHRELEDASSKTSELKNALAHAESRCTAAEEALEKSRQQRQQRPRLPQPRVRQEARLAQVQPPPRCCWLPRCPVPALSPRDLRSQLGRACGLDGASGCSTERGGRGFTQESRAERRLGLVRSVASVRSAASVGYTV